MNILCSTLQAEEYRLPDYWTAYLVNGDASGYDDEDMVHIQNFLDGLKEQGNNLVSIVPSDEEPEFSNTNDGGLRLGCEVRTFTLTFST